MSAPPETVAHPDEPVADPGLDRAQGDLELLGHLTVAVPAVVGQGDRLALDLAAGRIRRLATRECDAAAREEELQTLEARAAVLPTSSW